MLNCETIFQPERQHYAAIVSDSVILSIELAMRANTRLIATSVIRHVDRADDRCFLGPGTGLIVLER